MKKLYKTKINAALYVQTDKGIVKNNKKAIVRKNNNIFLERAEEGFFKIKGLPNYFLREEDIVDSEEIYENNISILMYHFFYDKAVGESKADHNFMDKDIFYGQMKYLNDNNYNIIDADQLFHYLHNKKIPKRTVMITIDDCSSSSYKYAFPILKKFNLKATLFMITNNVKNNNSPGWFITEKMKKEMEDSGLIKFESHSNNLHQKDKKNIATFISMNEKEIEEDIKKSVSYLNSKTIFCYPFGQYNNTIRKVLKKLDFKLAVTTEFGKIKEGEDFLSLPRIRIEETMSLDDFSNILTL